MSATKTSDAKPASAEKRASTAPVACLTVHERAARGKAARAGVPRQAHGVWEPSANRPDPIDVLEEQAKTRVSELVPIRYGRMLASPFAFYRGAAALMAADLADGPRTSLDAQLCGDAHLSNFGVFAAPDRRLVFSVNDFDETLPGPFEWDVKRLAASFAVAGRERGFGPKVRQQINAEVGRSYRKAMRQFAAMRKLDLWYARVDVDDLTRAFRRQATVAERKQTKKLVQHAQHKDSLRAFAKLTCVVDGERRIISDPPLIVPVEDLATDGTEEAIEEHLRRLIRDYGRTLAGDRRRLLEGFRYVHAARKVVGVGSVGTRAWIVLLVGRDSDDPLFMQVKEAQESVLTPYLGKSEFSGQGQRVVEGQRLMQATSDILLGWITTDGYDGVKRDFYIRQLWDGKGSADVDVMSPDMLTIYARACGAMLAKAHARSGDAVAIAAYLGTNRAFDRALAAFAESYADQNERDYDALTQAVRSGRVRAQTGV
jgi:uncharacterized protein (DUF2252 family)